LHQQGLAGVGSPPDPSRPRLFYRKKAEPIGMFERPFWITKRYENRTCPHMHGARLERILVLSGTAQGFIDQMTCAIGRSKHQRSHILKPGNIDATHGQHVGSHLVVEGVCQFRMLLSLGKFPEKNRATPI
jgi:hypothetical protein